MKKYLILIFTALFITGCATTSVQKNFTLDGDHGKLAVVLETPKKKDSYPIVMIIHGFNASKDMDLLVELAKQLHKKGIATVRFDFNGHGESEGSFLDMTAYNELEDTRKVYDYISKLPNIESVSMAGHSLGGVITAMFAAEKGADKIKRIVLLAPAGELPDDTCKGDLFGTKYDPKNIPEYILVAGGKVKIGRPFLKTSQNLPIYKTAAKYKGKVLIIHSKDDQLVPYSYGIKFKNIYKNVKMETLTGFDHNFTKDIEYIDRLAADFLAE